MKNPISENEIRALLDQYLEEHYGKEPVLSLLASNDPHKLKFNLVDETVTLTCDPSGNITEKKRKRPLPKSEVEGQLSLSDVFQTPAEQEDEGEPEPEENISEPEPEENITEPVPEKKPAVKKASARKGGEEKFTEGDVVCNIYTGARYTVVGSKEGIARVRPVGELSTLMLSVSDLELAND